MLRRKFNFCSGQVKNMLFSVYCNDIYIYTCSLWVSYRKRCMRQFFVYYNNSFRILRSLPMRCSASAMFASSNVDSCKNKIGPSTDPCGTPLKADFQLEVWFFYIA